MCADVVLDTESGVPTIVYWGAPLGDVDLDTLVMSLRVPVAGGGIDVVAPLSILPEHGAGFAGRPGLSGHRQGGAAWSPRFTTQSVQAVDGGVTVTSVDEMAGLRLVTDVLLGEVLAVRCSIANLAATRYLLDGLHPTLPVPERACELLTFDGRWTREFQPVRRHWPSGTWTSENRSGRTSHEHVPLVFAGTPGFGEWSGEVWGVHLAWSGNATVLADCLVDGRRYLQCGELLHPGEWCLESGDEYCSPWVYGAWSGHGLTPASWGFHRQLRSFGVVSPQRPRPVLLNTWEAVYFQQNVSELSALADVAAGLGVERFVLDDGWFGTRRDDWRGLGDWWVSPDVFPDGLAPLIDHVRGLGMEFGIWVEPEMVNPDSELYRQHPDWVLATDGYEPVLGRHQLVLDLGRDEVFQYLLGQLDALLRDHDIAYVKWDMNRPHVQGSGARGAAGTHRQTLSLLALLDELRMRHPAVEIESCASGGGRIDLGILARTARVWTSDCNDPLERQTINVATSMLIPYEVLGAHIGPTRAHTTGRVHSLSFRILTALFGHLGVEWDVRSLTEPERADLAAGIALHRRFRPLIHGGDVVRFDTADASVRAYGVYSADRGEALVAHVQLTRAAANVPPALRLPGLRPETRYRLEHVPLPGSRVAWAVDGLVLTGRQLAEHGVRPPLLFPESGVLLHLSAID